MKNAIRIRSALEILQTLEVGFFDDGEIEFRNKLINNLVV